jgi:hypothetical protein
MAQSKHEYFHLGITNQKTPDITVDLKRVDIKKMARWTPQQREHLLGFLERCTESFEAFKQTIIEANRLDAAEVCDASKAD